MSSVVELVAEFVPLNRRRLSGHPPLTVLELQRWSELRELLAWELGHQPPVRDGVERPLRVPSHLKVTYGEAGENAATLKNLSEGGLFIQTPTPLSPGTPLQLQIDPGDGSPPLDLQAVVVWQRDIANLDGPAGFGVEFRDLEADVLPGLVRLIERALKEAAQG